MESFPIAHTQTSIQLYKGKQEATQSQSKTQSVRNKVLMVTLLFK
jgi:hypothetical protein